MTQDSDPWAERKKLTFKQAEGADALPQQLKLKELSPQLRAVLWSEVHAALMQHREEPWDGPPYFVNPWNRILRSAHVHHDHGMIDEYHENADYIIEDLKELFANEDYLEVLGWLEFVLRFNPPHPFAHNINSALSYCHAAYRVIDDTIIVPIGSEEELASLKKAVADLETTEFHGARAHLKNAALLLSEGKNADSIRESIHAVESVARSLETTGKFSDALARLSQKTKIHRSMIEGFKKLYGYTSDENGIRHPLLDDGDASADEIDALFMIGACASFVTYLINKSRAVGLLGQTDL